MNATPAPPEVLPTTLDLTGLPTEVVKQVVEIAVAAREGRPLDAHVIRPPKLSPDEFRALLNEMAAMGMGNAPPLPADWSRADIYEDHD